MEGFRCSWNKLKNLIGGPEDVYEGYWAQDNELVSLDGAPRILRGSMFLRDNYLEDLRGAPEEVYGDFSCQNNMLKTMEGAPKKVSFDFSCSENQLTNLVGIPEYVGSSIMLYDNEIVSLEGIDNLKNLDSLIGGSILDRNPLDKKVSKKILKTMVEKNLKYKQALKEIWEELDDEQKVVIYNDLPNITDQEKKAYGALKGYLGIKGLL